MANPNTGEILITGGQGLVGSRITELLSNDFSFRILSRESGFDVLFPTLPEIATNRDAEWVFHFAAKADVDGCEKDRPFGENGDAWKINVEGTKHVVQACQQSGKKLLYISTDFVFDGEKGNYTEGDVVHPLGWYGYTKEKGEEIVRNSGLHYIIARIAYPYRASFITKKDFLRAIEARLGHGEEVMAVSDHIFTPTFIDDIAGALKVLVEKDMQGIFHVVGNGSLTPFEAAQKIAEEFEYDTSLIRQTTRAEYFKNGAPRPFNLSLKNDTIIQLGIRMRSFEEGLQEIIEQL